MQGRITERELPLAEQTFPGITEMYADLEDKSLTFLQLVWMYEEFRAEALWMLAEEESARLRRN